MGGNHDLPQTTGMVEQFEKDAEAFHQELYREHYLAESGLKDQLELTPIYNRYSHLFRKDVVQELLDTGHDRQRRYLAQFATLQYLEHLVKHLSEKISNAMRQATVEWRGQKVSYHNLRPLIANEPDMSRRHRLDILQRQVTAGANPDRQRRFQRVHDEARKLGFESYTAHCDQLLNLNLRHLLEQMQILLEETRNAYFHQLEHFLSDIGVPAEEGATSDMLHLFRATRFDALFPREMMIPALRDTLAGLGINLAEQRNVELDTEPRELKSPRAFCAPIRVPEEVKLVIKPIGGADDYASLFHEGGHAEHFANVAPDLPFAFKRLGDNAVTECYAFLFHYLPLNARWLDRILGIKDAHGFLKFARFQKLWFLRRYAGKLLYEQELHIRLDGADRRYVSLLGDALGVQIGVEDYLADVDDAFYCAQYLRAWILEAQLRRFLEKTFGADWFSTRKAGEYLISLWRRGQELTADELATDMGYDRLDARYLIDEAVHM